MTKQGYDAIIEALQIFKTYKDETDYNYRRPFDCEHDKLYVHVRPEEVSEEDKERLDELGFTPDPNVESFSSFRYGSA